ncbi:MAG: peptidoglycan DD-metalloendopeptidase family protein [Candidatus Scatovivens sp.]
MKFFEDKDIKKIIYLFLSIIIITALIFVVIFLWYNNKLTEESELSILNMSYANEVNNNSISENTKQVSFSEDKDIKNSVSNNTTNNITNKTKNTVKNESNKIQNSSNITNSVQEEDFEGQEIEVEEYKLQFEAPISGDITKDFAEDNLVYSKTLDEWTTHLGIDIKAEKTSVVKASEKGTIENIKNDPRYGLTIIISHQDGYKTMYSNLLSTEFVAVGDLVEKGQTIGTVGQSASFECADEAHLHFEMYKDGKNVNPTIYFN